jgi:hypothetical protein
MNIQEQIKHARGIVGLIIEAAGPREEWMPIDAKIAEIALDTVDGMEALLKENQRLREALEGWMIDHGDRCRICMERSQTALKEPDATLQTVLAEALKEQT